MVSETRQRFRQKPANETKAKDARVLTDLAFEIERLERDFRAFWHGLYLGKKVSLSFASMMILGVFLPWLSVQGLQTEIGLTCGGVAHLFLAISSLANTERRIEKANDIFAIRRHALLDIVIGFLAVLSSIFLLIYFASIRDSLQSTIDIRYGFYLVLACSGMVSLGGFLHFAKGSN